MVDRTVSVLSHTKLSEKKHHHTVYDRLKEEKLFEQATLNVDAASDSTNYLPACPANPGCPLSPLSPEIPIGPSLPCLPGRPGKPFSPFTTGPGAPVHDSNKIY